MLKPILFSTLLLTIGVAGAFADPAAGVSSNDKKFVKEAASGGMLEVQLGQYAAANASSAEVKDFGQHMADDHTKVNDELRSVIKDKGLEVPAELDSKDQKKLDKLEKVKGADFDKEYMAAMVKDHNADIEAFQKEAKDGEDADLKAFAEKALPTLQHHLEMAKNIEGKM